MVAHTWEGPKPATPEAVSSLAGELGVSEIVAATLIRRGLDDVDRARRFLAPDLANLARPNALKGFEAAVSRIVDAVGRREKVALYGDYDCDGVTAVALLSRFLKEIGLETIAFIPRRFVEGYGLAKSAVSTLAEKGATVLVTADCGISAADEVAFAKTLGMDVIVLDHHHVPPAMPDAVAVVNPLQPDCAFAYKGLSSVGLAFMLAIGVRARLREANGFKEKAEPSLRPYLGLVAIGTIADVSPLDGENRILVATGLKALAESVWPGVRALWRVANLTTSAPNGALDARDVAFKIAPRLNAAGRMSDAAVSFRLLTTDDMNEADALASEIDKANQDRQAVEARIVAEAIGEAEREVARGAAALVLWREGWHAGVVGIVAARILERFYRPAFIVSLAPGEAIARGSVRSTAALHAARALESCHDILVSHGGHAAAAGFSVLRVDLPRLAERIDEVAKAAQAKPGESPAPILRIDGELPFDLLTPALVGDITKLAPFGMGNPEPTWIARGVDVVAASVSMYGNLSLTLKQRGAVFRATGFRMGAPTVRRGDRVDVAYSIRSAREIRLRDLPRPHTP
ncbi:MAG: single-stranded-DNA-specific exonuclease RecJ [Deltaproteobacteria bacterium]|nr:single-stranded-DNA-specific exonuclease RecJ [Deltaproteobacteria bacterium]